MRYLGIFFRWRYCLALIFFIGFGHHSYSQTYLGVKAGINATKISYSSERYRKFYDTNFKIGYTVGGVFLMENKDKYGLNVEVLYSMKGKSVNSHANDYETNRANYHFIDAPIMFRVKFSPSKIKWYLQLGPEMSYWLGGKGEFTVYEADRDFVTLYPYTINFGEPQSSSEYLNTKGYSNRLQLGLAIGGGVIWPLDRGNFIALDFRYTFGHTYMGAYEGASIPNIGLVDNMEHTNNVASISMVYYFDILEKFRLSKNKYQKK